MTEQEALKSALDKVKYQKENFGFMERFNVDENWEVMKALEEIQEYREIGTVEDVTFYKRCYDEESYEYCGEYGTDTCGCKGRIENLEKRIAELQEIRNKVIDEFKAEAMKQLTDIELKDAWTTVSGCKIILREIAEQMKGV